MTEDLIKLEEGIGSKVALAVYYCTATLTCTCMAFIKGWKLALLCISTGPVTFLLVGIIDKISNKLSKKEAKQNGEASAIAEEVLGSMRTVYAFSGQEKELERYEKPLAHARRASIKKELLYGLAMGSLYLCIFISYALTFYVGIYLIINDPKHYNADVMFSVFFGIITAMNYLTMVTSIIKTFGMARGAGAHIFNVIDNEPTINPLLDQGVKPHTIEGVIELKNVNFHYPSRPDVPVLKGVSFSVKRGESVALVGHSGCGKSTIIQLISRYYDVIEGSISFGGRDVRDLSVRWLRSQIGLVGQEPVLFSTTVRKNIRYGRENATDEDIEMAARQANAYSFIMKLPKGYDTMVGEGGASLSGGQKQRIAIARALVRKPTILLLDEATSALDTSSEAIVQKTLDKAAEGLISIIVAHRLSTIRNVTNIYVFERGRVIESGSHAELIRKKGHYYEMLRIQNPYEPLEDQNEAISDKESQTSEVSEESFVAVRESEGADDEETSKIQSASLWRVMALNLPEWKYILIGSVSSVVIGFALPLFVVMFGQWFGFLSSMSFNDLLEKTMYLSLTTIGIGLVIGICSFFEGFCFGIASGNLTKRLRLQMFGHMLGQQMCYFDNKDNSTGTLCARLSSEVTQITHASAHRLTPLFQGIGCIGLALIFAMVHEWRVGLLALAFMPFVLFVMYRESKFIGQESFGNAKSLEKSTKVAVEAISNIRTVASLGREPQFVSEYLSELDAAIPAAKRSAHCQGIVEGMSRSMFNFVHSSTLTFGGYLMVTSTAAYNDIFVTVQSLQMAAGLMQNAFAVMPEVQKGLHAASRVFDFFATHPTIVDPDMPVVTNFKATGKASFKSVRFTYPTRPGIQVLRELDLQIQATKTIALVGPSGCGKSTVIRLLERFYDPDNGIVALDNIPLPQLLIKEIRANMGLVSQEPDFFDRTIAENIAYGDNSREPTQHEITNAAKQANIHNFIVSLPLGYDTNIGSKGTQLSGGQRQRAAIARALIRNPKILLLDEATSALDTESEKIVQEALNVAKEGRTCVTIAHRLSTIRDADIICVLHEGRVIEKGTHRQLMDLKGMYYKLCSAGHETVN